MPRYSKQAEWVVDTKDQQGLQRFDIKLEALNYMRKCEEGELWRLQYADTPKENFLLLYIRRNGQLFVRTPE